eukprot:3731083-Pleurochrysis_carterae.AAC.1
MHKFAAGPRLCTCESSCVHDPAGLTTAPQLHHSKAVAIASADGPRHESSHSQSAPLGMKWEPRPIHGAAKSKYTPEQAIKLPRRKLHKQ